MNKAIIESDIDINLYTKFILVSWDVGRPGLWYGIERFGTRNIDCDERLKMGRSFQQKRGPMIRQLRLCGNKRRKME